MTALTYTAVRTGPPPRDARELFRRLADQVLDQGGLSLRPLARPQPADLAPSGQLRALLDAGFLDLRPTPEGPRLRLAPRAIRACEELALLELFGPTGADGLGRHEAGRPGPGPTPGDDPRPHTPGAPLDHLDGPATLKSALMRQAGRLPLLLHPDDLVVRTPEAAGQWSVVLLLDMSGSMARGGLFAAARRAALAFRALLRRRFPGDELFVAGFATRVVPLDGADLAEAVPRPVGLVDQTATKRLPGALAFDRTATDVPDHFTNIHAGLRLARRWLRGRAGNRLVVVVTDGEPTAYLDGGEMVLAYPTTPDALRHTLAEARRCANEGIRLSVFALLSDTTNPALHTFGTRLARAGRGQAVVCPAGQVGRLVLRQFVATRNHSR